MTKQKTHKASKKRFRVTASGKLKRSQAGKKHLNSPKTGKRKRHLRNASVLSEGHAKNMRAYMGLKALRPNKIAAERKLAEKAHAAAAAAK